MLEFWLNLLGYSVILAPILLVALLGGASLLNRPLGERVTSLVIKVVIFAGLVASLGMLAHMLWTGHRLISISLGDWAGVPGYHFSLKFVFDRLSMPFVILSYLLCGTISAFCVRYLHRDSGFNRFFVLFAIFLLGMVVASLAGTIETLFFGWELVGLSSALLIAFFQDRPTPAANGLRVWGVYRISDAALLLAALTLHHMAGAGDFSALLSSGLWPLGHAAVTSQQALLVGGLVLLAAAGKSGLVPFAGWLPRAMEGPTPSSAIFYGALSVHLGVFLLLRLSPLIQASPTLVAIMVILGLVTALYATVAARVQTDVKSVLSMASLTQVGLMVAEIGLMPLLFGPYGLYLPLVHLLGHACLRTMQFIRAPMWLTDHRESENAVGAQPGAASSALISWLPESVNRWLYRWALQRGYWDAGLDRFLIDPFVGCFQQFERWEQRWTRWLDGSLGQSDKERF